MFFFFQTWETRFLQNLADQQEISDEIRKQALCHHNERLVVQTLLSTISVSWKFSSSLMSSLGVPSQNYLCTRIKSLAFAHARMLGNNVFGALPLEISCKTSELMFLLKHQFASLDLFATNCLQHVCLLPILFPLWKIWILLFFLQGNFGLVASILRSKFRKLEPNSKSELRGDVWGNFDISFRHSFPLPTDGWVENGWCSWDLASKIDRTFVTRLEVQQRKMCEKNCPPTTITADDKDYELRSNSKFTVKISRKSSLRFGSSSYKIWLYENKRPFGYPSTVGGRIASH